MHHVITLRPERFEPLNLTLQRALLHNGLDVEPSDMVRVQEHDPLTGVFTGRWLLANVTHVQHVNNRVSMLSLDIVNRGAEDPYVVDTVGRKRLVEQRFRGSIAA